MTLVSEPLPGVKVLLPFVSKDSRGEFVKPFHEDQLAAHGITMDVKEEFFSTSAAGVLRGMHFQVPPRAHAKLVYCIAGRVLDVVLDLRPDSPAFGKSAGFELSAVNRHLVHMPPGIAHGFLSLEDHSCMVYKTDAAHAPDLDKGIRWDSFGFDWALLDGTAPIISERDRMHPGMADFASPFGSA